MYLHKAQNRRACHIYVKVGENCQKKNKCCDHSIEPSRRDIPLNYVTPSYLEI